jgi:hypothetical protein
MEPEIIMEIFTLIRNRHKSLIYRLMILIPVLLLLPAVPGSGQSSGTIQLNVQFINGGSSIEFGNLRSLDRNGDPANDTALSQVRLIVNNTLNRSYIISQTLQSDTMNQSGALLPPEAIRFKIQQESGGGLIRVPDMTPLRPGTQEIFFSDSTGSASSILITYEILVPPAQRAGYYRNTVNYRVDAR